LIQNQILRYASDRLLTEANPEGKPYFKDTHFNKFIFLLYKKLQSEGIDLKLPVYWYRHGTLIHQDLFYHQIGRSLGYYVTNDSSTRKITRILNEGIPDSAREIINHAIRELVQKYKERNGYFKRGYINQLLDDDYFFAPYEFQRIFKRNFETYLQKFKTPARKKYSKQVKFSRDDIDIINNYLDELLPKFPHEMVLINSTYLEWDDTIRIALDYNSRLSLEIINGFWELFSKNLRILHHENISEPIICGWETRLKTQEYPVYQRNLDEVRSKLLDEWKKDYQEDIEVTSLVEKMNKLSFNLASSDNSGD
jgi:hypothetical protein